MSLEVRDLRKTYKKFFSAKPPFEAVRGVSFKIEPGEVYALLGPNGAGKSTIIKMIAGLIVPSGGRIDLDGISLDQDSHSYKRLSAVLEGTRNIYWRLTPEENLYYFSNLRGKMSSEISFKVRELLKIFEIEGKKKNQSQHLSRGMLQKLAFAAALITDPQILLLDEPTLGLDVGSARKIKDIILQLAKKENKTILLTTHQMNLVEEVADRVGIIQNGCLVKEGTISELRSVFNNYIYNVKISGNYSPDEDMIKKYSVTGLQNISDYTEFTAECRDHEGFYRMVEALKESGADIFSIQKSSDNLEDVFLRVLK